MADEIVKLKVTTEGDQAALQSLTKIDKLIEKINKEAATVKVSSVGTAEVLSELMSIADLIRQINQTPVNVAVSGLSDMENAAQKAADAASQYVENTNALVPAYTEAIKVGDQVVMCEQQILGAAQNRASAYDKAAEAAGNIIDVEYTIVEGEGKAANAAENTAKAKEKVAKSTENASKKQKEFNALASYLGIRILRSITQNIKKATDELKAMNTEMVSIQKVTGATDADMERLKNSAFDVAGAMGSTPSDYLSSVTKWAQAGYSWAAATDQSQKDRLQAENQRLGALIGANYDPASGQWDIFDYSGGQITVKPWAYNDYSGYSSQGLSAYSLGDDDGWENTRAQNGILSASDYAPASYATYSTSGDTVYNDDHSVVINGLKLGADMLQRSMSDVFRLIGLNMGT